LNVTIFWDQLAGTGIHSGDFEIRDWPKRALARVETYIPSFSRPGGNVTGISWFATELTTKRLELLHRLAIGSGAIGALINPTYEDAELQLREPQRLAVS
jgi:hypothetical protein